MTAHVNTASRGDTEMILRYGMRRMPSSHWKDIFEYMLTRAKMQHTEITNLKASDPSDTDDPLTIEFDVTASNYFDWAAAESKFVLPLGSIHLPNEDEDEDSDSSDNAANEPIKLGAIRDDQADVKITFPAKYKVHAPLNVDLKRDYAEYHSEYKFDAGQLTSHRTLKVAMSEIPESRKEDYAAFRRVVGADEAQQVTLESQSPAAAQVAGGGDQSADDLFSAAIQAYQNQHFQTAIDLLERVVKLDPKHKGAWDDLGDAYMNLGQTDKAIAAFKQQIENNPYDAFAYNSLGQAYRAAGTLSGCYRAIPQADRGESARSVRARQPRPAVSRTEKVCRRGTGVGEGGRYPDEESAARDFSGAGVHRHQPDRQGNGGV